MCRLLGLVANKPVDLEFSLERFKKFSARNPDGWGIGWYEEGKSEVFKQGISAIDEESKLPELSKKVISNIVISHVRQGTLGGSSKVNSHPFLYENWIFAHNGAIDREFFLDKLKGRYRDRIEGETDSEVYFYWILQNIEEQGDTISGIREAVNQVKTRGHTGMNFLLSDGKCLYAFRYSSNSRNYYSLFVLKRNPSDPGPFEHISKETRALLISKALKRERAVLVCSEKLTEEDWHEIGFGEILKINSDLSIESVNIL